ncbi:TetR/AcrR family transcriptional regulator [Blastococcus sp. URHD0036]|uniref:TetR/AcrR family transcriptional regulator n=1 Tax=Blastococcus sp. URHD0036 TaxID=1380356 RepID=UPI000495C3DE|nr:TetR/AcrR family transcriptional regulator [Blastococcus sp. URHD0036]
MSQATRKPRGEYAKTAARRQEIVAAAVAVFSASGFRDGSVRDVAERAGLTHAGVMHHFPTKIDLLQAVLAWRDADALERLGARQPKGLDVVRAWLDEVGRNQSTPELVDLHVTLSAEGTSPDHPLRDYFIERYDRVVELLSGALRVAAARGELRPDVDPEQAARMLVAATDGLQVQWLLNRDAVDMPAALRRYVESLITVEL